MDTSSAIQVVDLTKFYWAVGALIVMNFGTIVSVAWMGLRAAWFLAKIHSQIEQNTKDINNAFKLIKERP